MTWHTYVEKLTQAIFHGKHGSVCTANLFLVLTYSTLQSVMWWFLANKLHQIILTLFLKSDRSFVQSLSKCFFSFTNSSIGLLTRRLTAENLGNVPLAFQISNKQSYNSVQLIPKFSLDKLNVKLEVSTFIVFLTKHWMSWDECSENSSGSLIWK